ncbi:hypothetical protein C5U62_17115 [Pseudomonas protegens]|uniref:Secreted protein n=1 Tax=Pseudomonas protegens TaxID=380021 RepID=A0A2T6GHR2_9PSED|nr:hypothetical protein [Pseudomonas protegens]PUA43697.1 hypothetical protein C5U62_17115 [Pseudomonas protegens]RXU61778.1 hypothetical protein CW358_23245 [Pseudomonas protegens]
MRPTQLLLIGLLASTSFTALAADGGERPQQVREGFLASQEQIHGDANQETASTDGTGKAPGDAPSSNAAAQDI